MSPPYDERRPRAGSGVTVEAIDTSSLPRLTPLARHLLGRVTDRSTIPRYGSPEWDALPDQDPRRAAAVIVSAEAWHQYCSADQVAEDLRRELAADAAAQARRDAEDFARMAAGVRASANRPTYAELCDRRGEPERARRARLVLRGLSA